MSDKNDVWMLAMVVAGILVLIVACLFESAISAAKCRDAQKAAYASGNDIAIAVAGANRCD